MTVKDLLETLHCAERDNISYRFYVYETKQEFVFKNYDYLLNFLALDDREDFQLRKIQYFSFNCQDLVFTLSVRLEQR